MNKTMIITSVFISIFLLNLGLSMNDQAKVIKAQKNEVSRENIELTNELKEKELFEKESPLEMNKAFKLFVNLMRMLGNYSGTKMDLLFITKGEKDSLENHFTNSSFRKVKALPIDLKIDNFSREIEISSVLNDIYVLERQTDLKINEIINENNTLEVKGELYGV